jgi:hypothetical protein
LKAAPDGSPRYVGKAFGPPGLVKGKGKHPLIMCTRCGHELDAGEKFCTSCGKRNPHHSLLADRKLPMNKGGRVKKAKKRQERVMRAIAAQERVTALTKSAGAPYPIYTRQQAVRFMLARDLDSDDPGTRFAAEDALRRGLAG